MAAFLKLDSSTSPPSTKVASGTDYDYAVNKILTLFASSNTGVGTLSVNPVSNTGLTSIGTFVDTYYPYDAGDHPVGTTIITTTYTFYQDRQTATESLTRPIEFSSGSMQEQNDTSLNADLITTALANLAAFGVGSYQMSPTTPVGGTWTSIATITNYLDINESNNTYLWRKTAPASSPSTVRPVKINSTSPVSVKEMSDAEIESLTDRLRNRIVATGIGSYAIQAAAPTTGGTWTAAISSFSDTTRTQSNIGYQGTYQGSYSGSYSGSYTGAYAGSRNRSYTGGYAGSRNRTYTGTYSATYTGYYSGARDRAYTRYRVVAYRGFTRATYTGYYTGSYSYPSYTGGYAGSRNNSFTGAYAASYSGTYTGAYAGSYSGSYTGGYAGSYTGGYAGTYTGNTLNNDSTTISTVTLWIRTA